MEAQGQKRSSKLARERGKRIRTGDADPGGTIKNYISGSSHEMHVRHVSIFFDGELNRQSPLSRLGGGRNQMEPILPDNWQDAAQVRTEIHTLRIAEEVDAPNGLPLRSNTNPELLIGDSLFQRMELDYSARGQRRTTTKILRTSSRQCFRPVSAAQYSPLATRRLAKTCDSASLRRRSPFRDGNSECVRKAQS